MYIYCTRIVRKPQRRALSLEFHRSLLPPSFPPSFISSSLIFSRSLPGETVGGTKPPEIARVVLSPVGGAILYRAEFYGGERVVK